MPSSHHQGAQTFCFHTLEGRPWSLMLPPGAPSMKPWQQKGQVCLTMLAIQAAAEPPPGTEVRDPMLSTNFLTLRFTRALTSLSLPTLYLHADSVKLHHADQWHLATTLDYLLFWFELLQRAEPKSVNGQAYFQLFIEHKQPFLLDVVLSCH